MESPPKNGAAVHACFRWIASTLEPRRDAMQAVADLANDGGSLLADSSGVAQLLGLGTESDVTLLESGVLGRLVGSSAVRGRLRGWVLSRGVAVRPAGVGATLLLQAHAILDVWLCRAVLAALRPEALKVRQRRLVRRWRERTRDSRRRASKLLSRRRTVLVESVRTWRARTNELRRRKSKVELCHRRQKTRRLARALAALAATVSRARQPQPQGLSLRLAIRAFRCFEAYVRSRQLERRAMAVATRRARARCLERWAVFARPNNSARRRVAEATARTARLRFDEFRREQARNVVGTLRALATRRRAARLANASRLRSCAKWALNRLATWAQPRAVARKHEPVTLARLATRALAKWRDHSEEAGARARRSRFANLVAKRRTLARFAHRVARRRACRVLVAIRWRFRVKEVMTSWRARACLALARRHARRQLAILVPRIAIRTLRCAIDRWLGFVKWRRLLRDRRASILLDKLVLFDRGLARIGLVAWRSNVRRVAGREAVIARTKRRLKRRAWRQWLDVSRKRAAAARSLQRAIDVGGRGARRTVLRAAFSSLAASHERATDDPRKRRALRDLRAFVQRRRACRRAVARWHDATRARARTAFERRRALVCLHGNVFLAALRRTVAAGRRERRRRALRSWAHFATVERRGRVRRTFDRWREHVQARLALGRVFARALARAKLRCILRSWHTAAEPRRRRNRIIRFLEKRTLRIARETLTTWRAHARLERTARRFLAKRQLEARRSTLLMRRVLRAWRSRVGAPSVDDDDDVAAVDHDARRRDRALLRNWSSSPLVATPSSVLAFVPDALQDAQAPKTWCTSPRTTSRLRAWTP